MGLIERREDEFRATPETAAALEPERKAWLFARMFRAYFRDFDHALSDP